MSQIKVVLADPDGDRRLQLGAVLHADRNVVVAEVARDGRDAMALVAQLDPDVLFIEIATPLVDGIDVTRRLRDGGSRMHCVVLGSVLSADEVTEAFRAGAKGELAWRNIVTDGLECLHVVFRGGMWLGTRRERRPSRPDPAVS